ncbi:NADPH-dependent F420 reductase [Actinomycetospora cinnamomea]|uniref:Reduced coenzyme F420:NADP oxidoreductase n=1 Tax=Actinomycetospora cinnamomea TaxID=663609 RepID=A0A2U1FA11_9PSEU|nr:NADPH-dependent F420 reductase [Actinomycetospora cinnamomea]PVZ09006.1 reduced coenzyme F420:NADP oxidoreductase [Actinomycetospora cinnamomea]
MTAPSEAIDPTTLTVGVLGGTGNQGQGLALRWAQAGIGVIVGSRAAERAENSAKEYREAAGVDHVRGADNATCAAEADVVIAAVPWESHAETLRGLVEPLKGKILVDCVVPIGFDKKGPYPLPVAEGSAAQQAEQILPESRVTAAFHNVSAVLLADLEQPSVDCDVLVLGDDREATDVVRALADAIPGVRGIYGGRLRNAYQVECLTANLIAINRRYKVHASIKITDLD